MPTVYIVCVLHHHHDQFLDVAQTFAKDKNNQ